MKILFLICITCAAINYVHLEELCNIPDGLLKYLCTIHNEEENIAPRVREKREGGYIRFGRSPIDWKLRQKRDINEEKSLPRNQESMNQREQQHIEENKQLDPELESAIEILRLYEVLGSLNKKRLIKFGKRFMRFGKRDDAMYMRFGKDHEGGETKKTYIRFGRNNKEKKQYIRFGRSQ
ncbi:DgyrCDS8625 [Dimorphilus gyrociliatus]|nr:DgyrCDS8625 [Dimorphilus gyrociliatus]